ncbi:hypothetical protein [Sphingobium sp.]|uniref:hypothetical protein n=1 Tax=Sphingobium sp. TaxID=1912891 RepID=UPI002B531FF7|nr:hypothetical protein [Sphingobium sp.]HUD92372.1 hypothetical protein [Sphingobium sp.]
MVANRVAFDHALPNRLSTPTQPAWPDVYAAELQVHPSLINVALLPHLGNASIKVRTAMKMKFAHNLDHFLADEPLLDPVA